MLLPQLCIRRPVFATVMSLMIVLLGLISFQRLSVREYPKIDTPVVSVRTVFKGASPQVIESQVTQPLEDSLSGIEGVRTIKSVSREEVSQVTIEFVLERNVDAAANDVRDRVARVKAALPAAADDSVVSKIEADAQAIIWLRLSSDRHDALQISDHADRYVADGLKTLPGVASVIIGGERRYAMRLWIDRDRLAAFGLTPQDVESALRRQNVEIPSGRIESPQREFTVLTEADLRSEEQFNDMILTETRGYPVRLKDIGAARLGALDERNLVRVNGNPAVGLGIVKQSTANTLSVAQAVKREMERMQPGLPEGMSLKVAFDSSLFIERSIEGRLPHHDRGGGPGDAGDLRVPALDSLDADSVRHHTGGAGRRVLLFVPDGIHRQRADAPRPGARHWPGRRRRDRGAGELPPPCGDGQDADAGIGRRLARDRLRGGRDEPDARRGVCAARLHDRQHRKAVHRVCAHRGGRGRGVGLRCAHAHADDVLENSQGARIARPAVSGDGAVLQQYDERLPPLAWHGAQRALGRGGGFSRSRQARALLYQSLKSELSPSEDRGFFITLVLAPEGASMDYTDGYMRQIEALYAKVPEIKSYFVAVAPGLERPNPVNFGIAFSQLLPWEERTRKTQAVTSELAPKLFGGLPGVLAFPVNPAFARPELPQPAGAIRGPGEFIRGPRAHDECASRQGTRIEGDRELGHGPAPEQTAVVGGNRP